MPGGAEHLRHDVLDDHAFVYLDVVVENPVVDVCGGKQYSLVLGCWVFIAVLGLFLAVASRAVLHCRAQALGSQA